jgi:UDP-hydrolysing UDP-N-acetyl-D-glucosamine 2-epimerase
MEGSVGAVRRICVVTTSRADYGLLRDLMRAIDDDPDLELLVVATGMHLAPEFGLTCRDIEADGFRIARRIDMLQTAGGETDVAGSIGTGIIGFAAGFAELRPDIVVLLGDRFELLAPAVAAFVARIPIAHIHGGETSQGALDEGVRHSVTKLASLHFPATEVYRRRIVQMGEDPGRVFAYGAPGLDALRHLTPLTRPELEERLTFSLRSPVAIVTYHPVTLQHGSATRHIDALFSALTKAGLRAVFTKANADEEGRLINEKVAAFCAARPSDYRLFDNLGQLVYLSCLRHVDMMVGNSSSGLIEAPSFELPAVNIGDRQLGREKAANVIDVHSTAAEIVAGIRTALSPEWRAGLAGMANPYAGREAESVSLRIKEQLKRADLGIETLKKRFHDLPFDVEPASAKAAT